MCGCSFDVSVGGGELHVLLLHCLDHSLLNLPSFFSALCSQAVLRANLYFTSQYKCGMVLKLLKEK